MISTTDLVVSNLIRYFFAVKKLDEAKLKLTALDTTMEAHSPNLSGEHGYNGTKDQKLLEYSIKRKELEDEIKGWDSECHMYYNILHLYELSENDIEFLSLKYKDKLSNVQIAKKMFYTNEKYAWRKNEAILEKLSKYV